MPYLLYSLPDEVQLQSTQAALHREHCWVHQPVNPDILPPIGWDWDKWNERFELIVVDSERWVLYVQLVIWKLYILKL
jgi:hypothetical protein